MKCFPSLICSEFVLCLERCCVVIVRYPSNPIPITFPSIIATPRALPSATRYMSLMCLAQAPDTFACGVSGAPVTTWAAYDTGVHACMRE